MKFEHQISKATYHHRARDRRKDSIVFIVQRKILRENCQKKPALCADRRPLRRDIIASRGRFRPMGARQNLAFYYN